MSSCRDIDPSEAATYSIASPENTSMASRSLSASSLERENDTSIMRQNLSIRAVISTHSSFADRDRHQEALQHLVQIGEGLQGTIFEQVGTALVIKKESPRNESRPTRLHKEYHAHGHIYLAFQQFGTAVSNVVFVPQPSSLKTPKDDAFWITTIDKFPDEYRVKTTVFTMDRILPLPKIVRKALISLFYPRPEGQTSVDQNTIQRVLLDEPNKHCLARVYLGKKSHNFKQNNFSLRNFPLCLDAMQRFGLEVNEMAYSMGKAYATIQWGAEFDADDVEFVLGTLMTNTKAPPSTKAPTNFQERAVRLCLLDFGQCQAVNMNRDAEDVYRSFYGALVLGDNQWFIPHCHRDKELFRHFRNGYVEAGNAILKVKGWVGKFDMEDFMDGYEEYAEDFLV
ncbi:unnamed protein product [Clonostachys byssicola]|uniref:Uncharacterized protein n=1 Tax=Clonostachys byssicola TaxID=160290 RepID=A0A9N9UC73_9HYPO|nr:unnamed protein product [Clonostachys byssicola]